jgi:hypothetical protein
VYWLTENMVMKFLPPRVKGGMSYCCGCERPGVNSWTAFILKNPSGLRNFFDFFSGFEEFVKK